MNDDERELYSYHSVTHSSSKAIILNGTTINFRPGDVSKMFQLFTACQTGAEIGVDLIGLVCIFLSALGK